MTDCDDGDGAPFGSIEDVRSDFEDLADAFGEEVQRNVQARAEGEPLHDTIQAATHHQPGLHDTQEPFLPEAFLLLAHDSSSPERPLLRRSETADRSAPTDSDALELVDDAIEAGTEFAVDCQLTNLGGKPARSVTVELYAEHYEPDAKVDTTGGTLLMERDYGVQVDTEKYRFSGVTTMAPGTHISAFGHMDDGGPPYENVTGYSVDNVVAEDRTFTGILNGKPDEFVDGGSVPADRDDFTVEVYDTTLARYSAVGPGGTPFWEDPEMYDGIHLASVDAEFVNDPGDPTDRHEQWLTSSVEADGTTRLDRTTTGVGGGSTTTARLEGTVDDLPSGRDALGPDDGDGPGAGRAVTALYARVFSMGEGEVPEHWSRLDHTQSRFCCRTDAPRRS